MALQQKDAFKGAKTSYQKKMRKPLPFLRAVLYQFPFSHAIIGAVGMGTLIGFTNFMAGPKMAIQSGLVQAAITFFMAGFATELFLVFSKKGRIWSIAVPALFTTLIGTGIHALHDTPMLLATAGVIFLAASFHFTMLSQVKKVYKTIQPSKLWRLLWKKT